MCDDECALVGEVVVDVGDDLHGNVGLAGARRPHHHGQTWLHPRLDGFHLRRREGNGVPGDTNTTVLATASVLQRPHSACFDLIHGRCHPSPRSAGT